MSENLKNGLLVFVAALLVVNTVLLINNGSDSYVDPKEAKTTFQRTADVTKSEAKPTQADISAADPMAKASDKPAGPKTEISFQDINHDFGTINQDSEHKKVFTFTNTGSEPLVIENAKGSCGCTVPKYPKEPIVPGGTGEIEVVYKPGKQKNKQTKNVTITANTEPSKTILTITADVKEV